MVRINVMEVKRKVKLQGLIKEIKDFGHYIHKDIRKIARKFLFS